MKYANEAAFSRALCKMLRQHGWFVQRIETAMTGCGVPDIFCINARNVPTWLELKRVKHDARCTEAIPWRPGQQAWLHSVTRRHMQAYTLCCFNNDIWGIKHGRIYENNLVNTDQVLHFHSLREIV